jgi:Zn-dependent protease with chaperone function
MRDLKQHKALIDRLEAEAARAPARYRLKLLLLALAGYAFIAVVLGAGLLFSVGVLALVVFSKNPWILKAGLKLLILPLILSWFLLRAVLVRLAPPEGQTLDRETYPQLHAEIDAIRARLRAKPVHSVLLTDQFNASVCEVPRFGLFGPKRRYLMLGLPLLAALPRAEMRAVLAHEFGHLAGGHTRFGNWIYRVRQGWFQLLAAVERQGGAAAFVFGRFFARYAPFFDAYSFVLARDNEYEADRAAVTVAGRTASVAALSRVATLAPWLEETYWAEFDKQVGRTPEPPTAPIGDLLAHLEGAAGEALAPSFQRACAQRTGMHDTHPAMGERIAALGGEPQLPSRVSQSAARAWLGAALPRLCTAFDDDFRTRIAKERGQSHFFTASNRNKSL